ncbi:hypothetical protein F3Y22_tig00110610pilonHSYRG00141 [Hibiscus syriacus]|uniref:Uncharacterized protein n=1 Tax=Hibiscus syriacus TaxID=106335 RepID=A0A6A3A0B1_HIBSY|nr:hypothetical protein F3Y22_tig00110610pilonHSYRG00141 [Hibiscus syriacus]
MEGQGEYVRLGANKYRERQPIGTAAQTQDAKDYKEPPPAPLTTVRARRVKLMVLLQGRHSRIRRHFLVLLRYCSNRDGCRQISNQVYDSGDPGHRLGFRWHDLLLSTAPRHFSSLDNNFGHRNGINPDRSLGAAYLQGASIERPLDILVGPFSEKHWQLCTPNSDKGHPFQVQISLDGGNRWFICVICDVSFSSTMNGFGV